MVVEPEEPERTLDHDVVGGYWTMVQWSRCPSDAYPYGTKVHGTKVQLSLLWTILKVSVITLRVRKDPLPKELT